MGVGELSAADEVVAGGKLSLYFMHYTNMRQMTGWLLFSNPDQVELSLRTASIH